MMSSEQKSCEYKTKADEEGEYMEIIEKKCICLNHRTHAVVCGQKKV